MSRARPPRAFGDQRTARFTRASYEVMLRRHGLMRTLTTAALNVLGAAARVAWMAPLAQVARRWRAPRDSSRTWLAAHLQGLRSSSTLRRVV